MAWLAGWLLEMGLTQVHDGDVPPCTRAAPILLHAPSHILQPARSDAVCEAVTKSGNQNKYGTGYGAGYVHDVLSSPQEIQMIILLTLLINGHSLRKADIYV